MWWRKKPKNQANAEGGVTEDNADYRWHDSKWRGPQYEHWYAGNSDYQSDERNYWWHQVRALWANVGIGIVTLSAAVIAAVIAYSAFVETRRQADQAETQVEIARDTAKRQLRAYLSIVSIALDCVNCEKRKNGETISRRRNVKPDLRLRVNVKNFGATPAYGVQVCGGEKFLETGESLPTNYSFECDKSCATCPKITIGPGTETTISPPPLVSDEAMMALAGFGQLYYYGTINFIDTYRSNRSLPFCWIYERGNGDFMLACPFHNSPAEE